MTEYLNSQKYSECQLVTSINAAIYLGQPGVVRDSVEYERLVDLVGARHGSAISIEKANCYLGIDKRIITRDRFTFDFLVEKLEEGHPIEVNVWHKKVGYHSVLIINFGELFKPNIKKITKRTKKLRYVQVLNFRQATKHTLISWDNLIYSLLPKSKNRHSNEVAAYFYEMELYRHKDSIKIEGYNKGSMPFNSSVEMYNALRSK